MINLLENYATAPAESYGLEEDELISNIYRFAGKKDEWFNLLLSLSNCISVAETLPMNHPSKDISTRVMKHLKTAIKISAQLNASEKPLHVESALNNIPMGAVIINETGRVVEVNNTAEDFFRDSPYWNIDDGYLSAKHLRLNAEISPLCEDQHFSVITLPLHPLERGHDGSGLGKEKTSKPKLIHLTALPQNESESEFSRHFYLCFQAQPEDIIDAESLKEHYQLTDTEALVVTTLMTEVTSKKTANKLKLKDATIRGHLSSIYQKLEVTRKSDLIRKVLLYRLSPSHHSKRVTAPLRPVDAQESCTHEIFYLKDGRRLSYIEHPKTKSLPNKRATDSSYQSHSEQQTIILLHNLMGSGLELPPVANQILDKENIRVIVPERPGYGDSDSHSNRSHRDWVDDIRQLLDHLQIDKVKVLAHSIGGVYALAMAEFIPERIERVGMVNAMTRKEDLLSCQKVPTLISAINRSLKFAPFLIEPILKMAIGKDIEHFYSQQLNYIRPTVEGRAADINLLKTSLYRNYAIANLKRSVKQGVNIWAEELKLSFAETDFSITNTKTEYLFWHGEHDDVIPIEAAERLAGSVNTTRFNRMDCETHFLFARQITKVIKELVATN